MYIARHPQRSVAREESFLLRGVISISKRSFSEPPNFITQFKLNAINYYYKYLPTVFVCRYIRKQRKFLKRHVYILFLDSKWNSHIKFLMMLKTA